MDGARRQQGRHAADRDRAHAFDVPYIALVQAPDRQAPTADAVELEDRDGDEVLHCLGRRTASDG